MHITKKLRYSTEEEEEHAATWEMGAAIEYEDALAGEIGEVVDAEYDQGADPEYDDTVQADYDHGTDPAYDEHVLAYAEEEVAVPRSPTRRANFAFELGCAVRPLTQEQAPHPVVWRGVLKERHPVTGLVHRVPVYRLADGYWDCYREEELRAA